MSQPENSLARKLRNRHIQLIAIGGTIGVGLFLGSAKAIHDALIDYFGYEKKKA